MRTAARPIRARPAPAPAKRDRGFSDNVTTRRHGWRRRDGREAKASPGGCFLMSSFPTQARAVVIGGGIVGCSTAYHLGQAGLARRRPDRAAQAHLRQHLPCRRPRRAVAHQRQHHPAPRLIRGALRPLEAETGLATGWKMNGGLRLACNAGALDRGASGRRRPRAPSASTCSSSRPRGAGAVAADGRFRSWSAPPSCRPTDRPIPPTSPSRSPRARACRGRHLRGRAVGIERRRRPRHGGRDSRGRIACEVIVNCAGQWAREIGAMAGVGVPLVSVEHQYMVTEPIAGVTPTCRRCAIRTGSPITRRRSAGSSWAATSRTRLPGRSTASRRASISSSCPRTWIISSHDGARPRRACRRSRRRASRSLSAAPRASRPTAISSSARRRNAAASSSAPASTPSASPPAAAPARSSPNGSPAASRPTTSGPSTSAASAAITATSAGSASGPSRPTRSTTRSPGRTRSMRAAGRCGARRSTIA